MTIPECDASCCDVLFWMLAPSNDIYFVDLSTGEIFQVIGELIEAMLAMPAGKTIGVLDESGKVGIITPHRLQ